MRGQIGAHGRERDIAVQIGSSIRALLRRSLLGTAVHEQEFSAIGRIGGMCTKGTVTTIALFDSLHSEHAQGWNGRKVNIVKQSVIFGARETRI